LPPEKKTLGSAIDEVVSALEPLDDAARLTAIRAACEHLNISMPNQAPASTQDLASGAEAQSPQTMTAIALPATIISHAIDIRSFKEQKNPSNANEMACVLAYYLQHLAPADERKSEISASDVDKYFVQANFPLPKRSDQSLVNAKAAGYFDSAARGTYRLNAVGHNLVAHSLPRDGSQGRAPSPARKRSAKKRANGPSKKSPKKPSSSKRRR
jgi:hypothetical protein